ncbi:MAG TPA: response regulator [Blastocatellia bacterium]
MMQWGAEKNYSVTGIPGPSSAGDGRQVKVLVVDDDESMHEMLNLSLSKAEYWLAHALDVSEAKAILASHQPDIIVTDAMMPGTSGYSFIEGLKANPETAQIPIILWTVMEGMNGEVMDPTGRADFTLSKPFNLGAVEDKLNRAKLMARRHVDIVL